MYVSQLDQDGYWDTNITMETNHSPNQPPESREASPSLDLQELQERRCRRDVHVLGSLK